MPGLLDMLFGTTPDWELTPEEYKQKYYPKPAQPFQPGPEQIRADKPIVQPPHGAYRPPVISEEYPVAPTSYTEGVPLDFFEQPGPLLRSVPPAPSSPMDASLGGYGSLLNWRRDERIPPPGGTPKPSAPARSPDFVQMPEGFGEAPSGVDRTTFTRPGRMLPETAAPAARPAAAPETPAVATKPAVATSSTAASPTALGLLGDFPQSDSKRKMLPLAMALMGFGGQMLQPGYGGFGGALGRGIQGASHGLLNAYTMMQKDYGNLYKYLQAANMMRKMQGPQLMDLDGHKVAISGDKMIQLKPEKAPTPHGITIYEDENGNRRPFSYEDYTEGRVPEGWRPVEKGKMTDIEQFDKNPKAWAERHTRQEQIKASTREPKGITTAGQRERMIGEEMEKDPNITYTEAAARVEARLTAAKEKPKDVEKRKLIERLQKKPGAGAAPGATDTITIRDPKSGQTKQISREEARRLGVPGV